MNDAGFDSSGVVVAHSFGGYMAVKAANLYPEKLSNLILVDSGIRHPEDPIPDRSKWEEELRYTRTKKMQLPGFDYSLHSHARMNLLLSTLRGTR